MAPRRSSRKPLAAVNHNHRATRSARTGPIKPPAAEQNPSPPPPPSPPSPPSPPPAADAPDHADIADITSQLQSANISANAASAAPCHAPRNPFGGHLPTAAAPAPPNRPLTAYQHFCKLSRDRICAENRDATFAQINSMLGAAWKALAPEQRAPFEASVAHDRLRYHSEMSRYKQQQQHVQKERMAIEFYEKELKVQKALEFYDKHLAQQKHADPDAPAAPKQPRNAYNFFVAARFKETGGNSVFGLTAKIAEEWRALQTSRKKKDKALLATFNKMAAEDDTRYKQQMEQYNAALTQLAEQKAHEQQQFKQAAMEAYEATIQEKEHAQAFRKMQAELKVAQKEQNKKIREEKKAAKEAKAAEPKRAKNAYAIFFSAHATQVSEYIKENNVQHSMAKEIADRWKALSDAHKAPYFEEAEKDRERYRKEMEAFNAAHE
ncbi:cell surface glycoprotein [Gracilaria domingensis]|nr:cell surface glycoprotein [Gracilaria domingensis]